MAGVERECVPDEMLDVRRAAALAGRHPETIRRWVWSGRIAARRQGNRLLVARADIEALTGNREEAAIDLTAWAVRARRGREAAGAMVSGSSAADLVIEDRADRSRPVGGGAGR
jgi:hypothetical protein